MWNCWKGSHCRGIRIILGTIVSKAGAEIKAKHLLLTCTLVTTKWYLQEILVCLFPSNNFPRHTLVLTPTVCSAVEATVGAKPMGRETYLPRSRRINQHILSSFCAGSRRHTLRFSLYVVNASAHLPTSWNIAGRSVNRVDLARHWPCESESFLRGIV